MAEKFYKSNNMNYIFNKEYFDGLAMEQSGAEVKFSVKDIEQRNWGLQTFTFNEAMPVEEWRKIDGYRENKLYTLYPGLMIGTGNPHSMKMDSVIKCGFTFDYVTGLPYLPGSSLKGVLRSYFPCEHKGAERKEYASYIAEYVKEITGTDIASEEELDFAEKLEDIIFGNQKKPENKDIFLGAVPILAKSGSQLMDLEYITPHTEGKFKNPNPISMIKVRSNVGVIFCYVLCDSICRGITITADHKAELFRRIILDMGVGAKTNVGFGKFTERKQPEVTRAIPKPGMKEERPQGGNRNQGAAPNRGYQGGNSNAGRNGKHVCQSCGKPVKFNEKAQKYFDYCWECSQKNRGRA